MSGSEGVRGAFIVCAVYGALENRAEWFVRDTIEEAREVYRDLLTDPDGGEITTAWVSAVVESTDYFEPHGPWPFTGGGDE